MNRAEVLHQLQRIDLELAGKRDRLLEVEARLKGNEELAQEREAWQAQKSRLEGLRVRLREKELELEGLTEKITSEEARLYGGRITSPKELEGMEQEVRYLKRHKEELEDQVLDLMAEFDEHQQSLAAREARLESLEAQWEEEQVRLTSELDGLRGRLKALERDRGKIRAEAEPEDLASYDHLHSKKGGRAVAILEGNLCQACGVTVSTTKVQRARQGQELVYCGSCESILYAP
ncbi:MAG: zinc ribbon domain-containing protein [Anaerolineae bacterium]